LRVAGERLRIDAADAPGGAYVVLDLRTRTLTQVAPQARALSTGTIEQMQQLVGSIAGADDPATQPLLQLALDSLPDAQRQQAEAMLRQGKRDQAIPYRSTGAAERVAGIPCTVYAQNVDSGDRRTLCMARYADLGLSAGDARTLQTAMGLIRDTGGPWVPAAKLPGLPLRYAGSFGGQAYAGGGRLQAIAQTPLKAEVFADPPGYRIVSLFEMLSLLGAP
ncbi:MAG: hypothetical protein ACREVL_13810, partial [Solimonas sp.]